MIKEHVLYELDRRRGDMVTGGALSRELGVSRTAVWKAVKALRDEGNDIESVQGAGYRLAADSDGLSEGRIRDMLTTRLFGRSMEIVPTATSTNSILKSADTAVLPEGHTVIADCQTGGRGRLGRRFLSPAHEGLYMSILVKPSIPPAETQFLTVCAAVAAAKAVEDVFGVQVGIKWVNDLYHNGKKLCGILTEAFVSAEMQAVEYGVVGFGINTGAVPDELKDIATSTYAASGRRGLRCRLAAAVLSAFERVYFRYTAQGEKAEILTDYTRRLFILGKRVRSHLGFGAVRGVDGSGGLIVEEDGGALRHINSGEVHLCEENHP